MKDSEAILGWSKYCVMGSDSRALREIICNLMAVNN